MDECRSRFIDLRGLQHHLREWGPADAAPLFMLHGWMDASASFRFIAEALPGRRVVAPDWRGFGLSAWAPGGYWFPDYIADLDALLSALSPETPADIVGHSLGGNVACLYAGLRPERVHRVVSLEGFGIPRARPEQAPGRLRDWLAEQREGPEFRSYASFDELAARVRRDNPRLSEARAVWVARHWARETGDGKVALLADPVHRQVNPYVYRYEEVSACWREIRAPLMWVAGEESWLPRWLADEGAAYARRRAEFADLRFETVARAGHMLHLEQPEAVAALIDDFLPAGAA